MYDGYLGYPKTLKQIQDLTYVKESKDNLFPRGISSPKVKINDITSTYSNWILKIQSRCPTHHS